jgi:hypothetical protein
MRTEPGSDPNQEYTNPATESLNEALARLALQDKRLNPDGPTTGTRRIVGPTHVTRDRVLTALRWVIVLVIAWFVLRLIRGA